MIRFLRKYASVIVLVFMSAFAVCLIADEWGDMQRAWQDMQIEATAEIEADDYEWDEADEFCGTGRQQVPGEQMPSTMEHSLPVCQVRLNAVSLSSSEQKRGLVRRYAPRKGIVCVVRTYYVYMDKWYRPGRVYTIFI